jgi:predicted amidohydrolase YtcJ
VSTLYVSDRVLSRGAETSADAILVTGGRIDRVGNRSDLETPFVRVEHLLGGSIIPGLADAHFHPVHYTGALRRLVVKQAVDHDDLVQRIRAAAAELPPGQALMGIRLDDESMAERTLPTRHVLDAAAPDRPVLLYRYCGHVAVANTAALEAAGIDRTTGDPAGGHIDRDEHGRPNGILRETAIGSVSTVVGARSTSIGPDDLIEAGRRLAAMGLTGLGAIIGCGDPMLGDGSDEVQIVVDAAPSLGIPMSVLVSTDTADLLEAAAKRLNRAGRRVRFGGVKLFADGSLGGHTAAMFEPYADAAATRGALRLEPEADLVLARRALALGGMVAVHAIGDAAVSRVLDFFEVLLDEGTDPHRLRMEHVSVITDTDLERMARMGIIGSVQPAFLASEAGWLGKRLGPDRLERAYRFRSMLEAGIPLAGGSDCPVEPPHPLHGIASAVGRGGLVESEALTPTEAIEAFTSGAALAMGGPDPLAPGAPANFTVVAGDLSSMSENELRAADVLETIVDGERVPLPDDGPDWVA